MQWSLAGRWVFMILLEGNALQIVTAVKMEGKNWSKFGHLVDGIKEDLHHLRFWRIDHIKRDANSATHGLAIEAIKHVIDKV
jgi:hypothetical protein